MAVVEHRVVELADPAGIPAKARAALAKAAGGVDAFLAIGTLNRRYYEQNGVDPARITLVPYAVDNAHFRKGALAAAQSLAEVDGGSDEAVLFVALDHARRGENGQREQDGERDHDRVPRSVSQQGRLPHARDR